MIETCKTNNIEIKWRTKLSIGIFYILVKYRRPYRAFIITTINNVFFSNKLNKLEVIFNNCENTYIKYLEYTGLQNYFWPCQHFK